MRARVGTVNPYAEPSTKKALAISESSSDAAAGLNKKSNKEVEVLINQPDNARRDPTRIPQILTVLRTTIEGSEHPILIMSLWIVLWSRSRVIFK